MLRVIIAVLWKVNVDLQVTGYISVRVKREINDIIMQRQLASGVLLFDWHKMSYCALVHFNNYLP